MNIVGLSPYGGFELYDRSLGSLAALCDVVLVRVDPRCANVIVPTGPEWRIFTAREPWDRGGYHEELLRKLDDLAPDVVVALDDDESFDDVAAVRRDLGRLAVGEAWQCWFKYGPMPTADGSIVPVYPLSPHVKAFRWRPELSYLPYAGRDQVANLVGETTIVGEAKVLHWCFWTPEMRRRHEEQVRSIYAAEIAAGLPVLP